MKKIYRLLIPVLTIFILSVNPGKIFAQPERSSLPDQHGYNGNQSSQGAPLEGGPEVLVFLGIAYAAKKNSDDKSKTTVTR
jgi:hypothetical protein